MNNIYNYDQGGIIDIKNFLLTFSGIICAITILICLFKGVMNSDEMPKYIQKIKNSLIALILILTVTNIVNIIKTYFLSSEIGIGKTNNSFNTISDSLKTNDTDKLGREVVFINNEKYVVTNRNEDLYIGVDSYAVSSNLFDHTVSNILGYEKTNLKVDVLKKFGECQDKPMYGGFSKAVYYRLSKAEYGKKAGIKDGKVNNEENRVPIDGYAKINSQGDSENMGLILQRFSMDMVRTGYNQGWLNQNGINGQKMMDYFKSKNK